MRPSVWLRQWILRRHGRLKSPVEIHRRRIYIVPSRFGYGFVVMVIMLILGATNYSNSMVFGLAFLLAALGLMSMHHTHANLLGLRVSALATEPVEVGSSLWLRITLHNPSRNARYAIELCWDDALHSAWLDVAAESKASVDLALATRQRGWRLPPALVIRSEFPLGLMHAWTLLKLDAPGLVTPRPADSYPPLPQGGGESSRGLSAQPGTEEFDGLRRYQAGAPLQQMYWKHLAKHDEPMLKGFADAAGQRLALDYQGLGGSTEQRLSILARWVLLAEAQHTPYSLRLPNQGLGPGLGPAHAASCLRALALYAVPPDDEGPP